MRVTKPAWVEHVGERKNRCPIYSLSVHPDGTRLATGGLDRKVKIWSTVPILDKESEADDANHKLLCTMSEHTGSVLAVRWAHHGRFLASGSDDQVVMIWGLDPDGGGRLWGSDEVNVENWKPLTRLVAHQADVVDIAWSRDDSMLASTGLDSKVWIWDGATFERIRKIDQHQGFVKGVCWDPVGNYLATQSDDKTVKVWDTDDWSLVQSISEPFKNSGHATFFRRLSWSPDGAFIAASNARNGPVFVAAVIDREGWSSEISFVGHQNTIQVASFNPRLFFKEGEAPARMTASCMLALGADDFSISIWRNTLHKPLVVLHDTFVRNLLDLCWSNDGLHLYGCSEDGTICAISFSPSELPELGAPEKTDVVLKDYGYHPKRQISRAIPLNQASNTTTNGFGHAVPTSSHQVNILQPRKAKPADRQRRIDLSGPGNTRATPIRNPLGPPADMSNGYSAFDAPLQPLVSPSQAQASTARMFRDAHMAFEENTGESSRGHKRKASAMDVRPKGRMMGSASGRTAVDVREIRAPRMVLGMTSASGSRSLPVATVQTLLRVKPKDAADKSIYLEAQNAEDAKGQNTVSYSRGGEDVWLDFLPSAVLSMAISERLSAVACEDGGVYIYSLAGRHLFSLKLGSPCSEMTARGHLLAVVTADCVVQVINVKTGKAVFPPASCSHLLDTTSSSSASTALELIRLDILPSGIPVIVTSEPAAHAYDPSLLAWQPVVSSRYLPFSPIANRRVADDPAKNPVGTLEAELLEMWIAAGSRASRPKDQDHPEWWGETMEIGYWEERTRAAVVLDSPDEWKGAVSKLAGVFAREGFRGRGEELLRDLLQPSISPQSREPGWSPAVLGLQKRNATREVVAIFARSNQLEDLATKYQTVLDVLEEG